MTAFLAVPTAHSFAADRDLFYASSHQHPCYPGTGAASERGIANNIVNAPLRPGSGSAAFRAAWSDIILPELDRFAPGLMVVSAGFDAHRADPLAQLRAEILVFISARLHTRHVVLITIIHNGIGDLV